MDRSYLLAMVWTLLMYAQILTLNAIESKTSDETQVRSKRGRHLVMFGKREDNGAGGSADLTSGQAEKRPFGFGNYQWSGRQTPDSIGLDSQDDTKRAFGSLLAAGRPRRRFLFGKRTYDEEDGGNLVSAAANKRRTFSFGRRSESDARLPLGPWSMNHMKRAEDDLDIDSLIARGDSLDSDSGYGDMEKRGRLVMLGKRPFGVGIHRWGTSNFGGLDVGDRSFLQDEKRSYAMPYESRKRLFKFGKRSAEEVF